MCDDAEGRHLQAIQMRISLKLKKCAPQKAKEGQIMAESEPQLSHLFFST